MSKKKKEGLEDSPRTSWQSTELTCVMVVSRPLLMYADLLPIHPRRASLVHSLIRACGLLKFIRFTSAAIFF